MTVQFKLTISLYHYGGWISLSPIRTSVANDCHVIGICLEIHPCDTSSTSISVNRLNYHHEILVGAYVCRDSIEGGWALQIPYFPLFQDVLQWSGSFLIHCTIWVKDIIFADWMNLCRTNKILTNTALEMNECDIC